MITYDVEQNTPEWIDARRGIITASAMNAVTSKGRGSKPSVTRLNYMMKLLAERMENIDLTDDFKGNASTERGYIMEVEARNKYAFMNDVEPVAVGFITTNDRSVGASLDSLVGDDGCLEIKSKLPHIHIPLMLNNEIPKEHELQIQTQLYVSEREWCDFVSYWRGLQLVQVRAYRDEAKIKEIKLAVSDFNEEITLLEKKLNEI